MAMIIRNARKRIDLYAWTEIQMECYPAVIQTINGLITISIVQSV